MTAISNTAAGPAPASSPEEKRKEKKDKKEKRKKRKKERKRKRVEICPIFFLPCNKSGPGNISEARSYRSFL